MLAYDPRQQKSGAYVMKFESARPEKILGALGKPRIIATEGKVCSNVRAQFGEFANVTFTLNQAPDIAHAINIQVIWNFLSNVKIFK